MKIYLKISLAILMSLKLNAQSPLFTWVAGDSVGYKNGIYGTKGVAATTNKPGSRQDYSSWKDNNGDLWLFGGMGLASVGGNNTLNDLWRYTISTNQWTWISGTNTSNGLSKFGTKGIGSSTNTPGSRYGSFSWADASGNLWLFGGLGWNQSGSFQGLLNDLWKYNISSNQWTWMSGDSTINPPGIYGTKGVTSPSNKPGGRNEGYNWIDNGGNLWLYGGGGYADLWKYDVSINQWTWMSGSNVGNSYAVFGTKGFLGAVNFPGLRDDRGASWKDNMGNFWLFGGYGKTATSTGPYMNDLWKYDISLNQWAWMSGDSIVDKNGLYGIKGVPSATNIPGSRRGINCWKDNSGNFWLSGGEGYPASGNTQEYLNDLWYYNISNNQWTWYAGDSIGNQNGKYGLKGVASATNIPGSRMVGNHTSWVDNAGNLWFLGGVGYPASGASNRLNDLWKIDISAITKINEITDSNKDFILFPNPNNGSFILRFENEIINGELILFNSFGQQVHSQKITGGENKITTNGLAKGLYHYTVLQNKQLLQSGKMVVE
jgi:N-acetylneuraminic acid mutarotase